MNSSSSNDGHGGNHGNNDATSSISRKFSRIRFTSDCLSNTSRDEDAVLDKMADSYRGLLKAIGENPEREGLIDTPKRAAKALMFFTKVSLIL